MLASSPSQSAVRTLSASRQSSKEHRSWIVLQECGVRFSTAAAVLTAALSVQIKGLVDQLKLKALKPAEAEKLISAENNLLAQILDDVLNGAEDAPTQVPLTPVAMIWVITVAE